MSERISTVGEISIQPGKLEALKDVVVKLIQNVEENEPYTLIFAFHLNEDGTKCTVIEHYQNSAAAMTNLVNLDPLVGIFPLLSRSRR